MWFLVWCLSDISATMLRRPLEWWGQIAAETAFLQLPCHQHCFIATRPYKGWYQVKLEGLFLCMYFPALVHQQESTLTCGVPTLQSALSLWCFTPQIEPLHWHQTLITFSSVLWDFIVLGSLLWTLEWKIIHRYLAGNSCEAQTVEFPFTDI